MRPQEGHVDGTRNIWVLKPSYGSKGLGVRLLNDGLSTVLAEKDSQRVVQKYVERPLLVGGYKFDIRCWVLVTEWQPLTCWMYEECLLRFCSEQFCLDDLQNRYCHITNRAVNQRPSAPAAHRLVRLRLVDVGWLRRWRLHVWRGEQDWCTRRWRPIQFCKQHAARRKQVSRVIGQGHAY